MKRAIFFDRDGVLNENTVPVNKPEQLKLYDGVKEALKKASDAGFDVFIVTNQGGIELGHLTHKDLEKIHERLKEELKGYCQLKDIAYCPDFHQPSEDRKPKPGMLLKLAQKHHIDLNKSWLVGDMESDVTAGLAAGCYTAKIGEIDSRAHINEALIKGRNKKSKVDLEAVVEEIIRKSNTMLES